MKKAIREVGNLVIDVGTGIIIGNAVACFAPVAAVGLLTKVAISAGGFTMCSMIEDKVSEYYNEKMDEIEEFFGKKKPDEKEES